MFFCKPLSSLATLSTLLFAGCADYLPGTGVLAPADLSGYEIDATGLEGSYHYRFAEDGTYSLRKTLPSKKKSPPESGTWVWERKSLKDANLILDGTFSISLNFTTREHANATIPGSERLFAVELSPPK